MASGTIPQTWNDSGTGYCKMPDGTLIQWGEATVSRAPNVNETGEINFPIRFAEVPIAFSSFKTRVYAKEFTTNPSTVTATYLQIMLVNNTTTDRGNGAVNWLAIGRWK